MMPSHHDLTRRPTILLYVVPMERNAATMPLPRRNRTGSTVMRRIKETSAPHPHTAQPATVILPRNGSLKWHIMR